MRNFFSSHFSDALCLRVQITYVVVTRIYRAFSNTVRQKCARDYVTNITVNYRQRLAARSERRVAVAHTVGGKEA
jgi:ABC-type transporter MlaC component